MPVTMKRSIGTAPPKIWTVDCGSSCGSRWGSVVNAISIDACSVSSTPSEATIFPNGALFRSGLNNPSSMATTTSSRNTSDAISAGTFPSVNPSWSVLNAQNA